jgi:hypothetical protein
MTGVVFTLFGLWTLERFLAKPSRRLALARFLHGGAVYFSHRLACWVFLASAAVLIASHPGPGTGAIRARAAALASPWLVLGGWALIGHPALHLSDPAAPPAQLFRFAVSSMASYEGDPAYLTLVILWGAWMVLLLSAPPRSGPYRLELVAGAVMILALFLPTISVGHALATAYAWRETSRTLDAPLERILTRVERGARTLVWRAGDPTDALPDGRPTYALVHARPLALSGGADVEDLRTRFPVVLRPEVARSALSGRSASAPSSGLATDWPYVLIFDAGRASELMPGFDLLGREGSFRLYRVRR